MKASLIGEADADGLDPDAQPVLAAMKASLIGEADYSAALTVIPSVKVPQ